jgi:hypothetical protein
MDAGQAGDAVVNTIPSRRRALAFWLAAALGAVAIVAVQMVGPP